MRNESITIIGTAPHTFHGAGTIKHRILHALHEAGYDAHFVGLGHPYFLRQFKDQSFTAHSVITPESQAYRDSGKTFWSTYSLAEKIADLALEKVRAGQRVILWGTYLHPYVQSLCLANDYIAHAGGERLPILSFPAGSDIWESGPAVARSVRLLLESPGISGRATYSKRFIREIRSRYGIRAPFFALPPLLDRLQFRMISRQEREDAKRLAGIPKGAVVILHHSNLRPVKRVQDTIELAELAAGQCANPVILLIVGPEEPGGPPWRQEFVLFNVPRRARDGTNITIVSAGLASDVRPYLAIADVAVNTSVHDSFNVSLLEAAWSGSVCVTTRAPAISDYFKAGKCGVLLSYGEGMRFMEPAAMACLSISPFDLKKGARELVPLLDNPDARDSMARDADAFLTRHLNHASVLSRYERALRALIQ